MTRAEDFIDRLERAQTPTDIADVFSEIRQAPDARAVTDAVESRFVATFRENLLKAGDEIAVYATFAAMRQDADVAHYALDPGHDFGKGVRRFGDMAVKVSSVAGQIAQIKGDEADPVVKAVVRAFACVLSEDMMSKKGKLQALELIAAELGSVHKPENAAIVKTAQAEIELSAAIAGFVMGEPSTEKCSVIEAKMAALPAASQHRLAGDMERAFVEIGAGLAQDSAIFGTVAGLLDMVDKMPLELRALYKSQVDTENPDFKALLDGFMGFARLALVVEAVKGESKVPIVRALVFEFSKLSDEEYADPLSQVKALSKSFARLEAIEAQERKAQPPQNPFRNRGPKL